MAFINLLEHLKNPKRLHTVMGMLLYVCLFGGHLEAMAACNSKSLNLEAISAKTYEILKSQKSLAQTATALNVEEKSTAITIRDAALYSTSSVSALSALLELKKRMVDPRDTAMVEAAIQREAPLAYSEVFNGAETTNGMIGLLQSPGVAMQAMRVRDDISGLSNLLSSCKR